jgi:predicted alpha/beta hydrolase family esterase
MRYLMIPGIDGSDDAHWQTIWERQLHPRAVRIAPSSWSRPDLQDWTQAIDDGVSTTGGNVVLVAHSLGCLAAAHWNANRDSDIRGIFLVAPPDVRGPEFPAASAVTFTSVRTKPLFVPGLVVVSEDDPYCSAVAAERISDSMQLPLVSAGRVGHLNSASRLGDWSFGRALLTAFTAGMPAAESTPVRPSRRKSR